jgi:hypothetical protein
VAGAAVFAGALVLTLVLGTYLVQAAILLIVVATHLIV